MLYLCLFTPTDTFQQLARQRQARVSKPMRQASVRSFRSSECNRFHCGEWTLHEGMELACTDASAKLHPVPKGSSCRIRSGTADALYLHRATKILTYA